jgi:hypothetical protein
VFVLTGGEMNTNQVLNELFYIGRNANAVNSISNHSDEVHCPGFCDRWTGRSSLNLRHAPVLALPLDSLFFVVSL